MAKYELRIKARKLRSEGVSLRTISRELGVAKSTASLWTEGIILSADQLQKIRKSWLTATEPGRLKGSLMQRQRRLEIAKKMEQFGLEKFKKLADDQFFVAGIALYWAEGSKKIRKLELCNSDPKMIKFMVDWFGKYFDLDVSRFSARVAINEIHKKREEVIKEYWSNVTKIPIIQFRKTSYKKVKPHKVYANYDHYFGTLDLVVLKPGELYYKMLGLVAGLANVAQW
jgi:transcriptional regulator with XRE-family HTH domain